MTGHTYPCFWNKKREREMADVMAGLPPPPLTPLAVSPATPAVDRDGAGPSAVEDSRRERTEGNTRPCWWRCSASAAEFVVVVVVARPEGSAQRGLKGEYRPRNSSR